MVKQISCATGISILLDKHEFCFIELVLLENQFMLKCMLIHTEQEFSQCRETDIEWRIVGMITTCY